MEWAGLVMKELSEDEYIAHLDTDDLPVLKRARENFALYGTLITILHVIQIN